VAPVRIKPYIESTNHCGLIEHFHDLVVVSLPSQPIDTHDTVFYRVKIISSLNKHYKGELSKHIAN
jgi:hypothetical protein